MSKIEGNKAARIEIQQQQMQGNGKVQEQEQTISAFGDGYQTEETGGDGFSRTTSAEVDEQPETQEAPKDDGKLLARDENGKLTGKINWGNTQTDKTPDELVHENAERIRNAEHFEEEVSLNDGEEAARTAAKEQAAKVAEEKGLSSEQADSYVRMAGNSAVLKERVHQNAERIAQAEHFEEEVALNDGEEAARTAAKEQAAKVAEEQGMSADQADSYIRMAGNSAVLNERIHQKVANAEANGAGTTNTDETGTTEASSDETNIDANAGTESGKVTGQQQQQTVIVDGKVVAQQQMQDGKPVESKDINVNVGDNKVETAKTDKSAETSKKADTKETGTTDKAGDMSGTKETADTKKTEKATDVEKADKKDKTENKKETTSANSKNVYEGFSTAAILDHIALLANSNDPNKGDKILTNIANLPEKQRNELIKGLAHTQVSAYVNSDSNYKMSQNSAAKVYFIDVQREDNTMRLKEFEKTEPDKSDVEAHKKWEVKRDMYKQYGYALRDQKEQFTGVRRGVGYVAGFGIPLLSNIGHMNNPSGSNYYGVSAATSAAYIFRALL